MSSNQRILAALNHQISDRIPLDLGASAVTGMRVVSVYALRQALLVGFLAVVACRAPLAERPVSTQTPIPLTAALPPAATVTLSPTLAEPTVAPTAPPAKPTAESTLTPTPEIAPSAKYGQVARRHLDALAGDIGARWPGTDEEAQAAHYVQSALTQIGYTVEVQTFSFDTEDGETLESANLIAVKVGQSRQEIIVGAHYDSSDEADGADDNASGVAVLLEAAQVVYDLQTPYTIRFITFGAEENDLDGSYAYVDQMSEADVENTVAMINLDSLIAGDKTYVYGDDGPGSLRDWMLARARQDGFDMEGKTSADMNNEDDSPCECADYDAFENAGIPFAYFEATNWDLSEDGMTQVDHQYGEDGAVRHTEYDTLEYIDSTFPGRIEHHLNVFVTLLVEALTEFQLAE